ncbi:hypothetical protein SORBI_3002G034200 [Sorghum bicolor]|uniref:Uncharacterized protein n=1 Tax=Sorghum bicolor TaxID=4558 RepID=A0A1B6Q906_SORBI|nr:hypothetical protein SORBI_3002G034200 [Sorghum bicolor]KXG34400.1 hypothetical protein SORBI_3002G034200 [Sorghum bicolor]
MNRKRKPRLVPSAACLHALFPHPIHRNSLLSSPPAPPSAAPSLSPKHACRTGTDSHAVIRRHQQSQRRDGLQRRRIARIGGRWT